MRLFMVFEEIVISLLQCVVRDLWIVLLLLWNLDQCRFHSSIPPPHIGRLLTLALRWQQLGLSKPYARGCGLRNKFNVIGTTSQLGAVMLDFHVVRLSQRNRNYSAALPEMLAYISTCSHCVLQDYSWECTEQLNRWRWIQQQFWTDFLFSWTRTQAHDNPLSVIVEQSLELKCSTHQKGKIEYMGSQLRAFFLYRDIHYTHDCTIC